MAVTFELLETFTGTRTVQAPDPDNEGQTIDTVQEGVKDIQVRFTCADSGCVHERSVNVCFDADGAYDEAATLVRVQEVANGVGHKIAAGVISNPAEPTPAE